MKALIIVMIVLSAVLPIIGLVRLVRDAYSDKSTPQERRSATEADPRGLDEFIDEWSSQVREDSRREVWWDVALIGLGVTLGAAASILSLP